MNRQTDRQTLAESINRLKVLAGIKEDNQENTNDVWPDICIRWMYGEDDKLHTIDYSRSNVINDLIDKTIQNSMSAIKSSSIDDIAINFKKIIDKARSANYKTKTKKGYKEYKVYPFETSTGFISRNGQNPLRILDTMISEYVTKFIIDNVGIHPDDVKDYGIHVVYNISENEVYFMTNDKHFPISDKKSIYNAIDRM